MVKYVLQTVVAQRLPRWGVDLQVKEGALRGRERDWGLQGQYLERGGWDAQEGFVSNEIHITKDDAVNFVTASFSHLDMGWVEGRALILIQKPWFGHWLPTFPSTAPQHPSLNQPGCLAHIISETEQGECCKLSACPSAAPAARGALEQQRAWLAAPLRSGCGGCKAGRCGYDPRLC